MKRTLAATVIPVLMTFSIVACSTTRESQHLYISEEGRNAVLDRYDRIVDAWSAEKEDLYVSTSFGLTHVIRHANEGRPTLMLFHAAGVTAASWFENFDALSQHFEVLAIDTPGDAGKSELYSSDLTTEAYNRWISQLLDHFGLTSSILCGHSIGGFIVANFASAHPERVERLILLAPAATFADFRWYIRLALTMARPGSGPEAEKTLTMQAHDSYVLDPGFVDLMEAVRVYCAARMIFPRRLEDEELSRIVSPTLVLIAADEVLYDPQRAARRAAASLPDATVEVVSQSGHTIIMERPRLVNERIVEFVF